MTIGLKLLNILYGLGAMLFFEKINSRIKLGWGNEIRVNDEIHQYQVSHNGRQKGTESRASKRLYQNLSLATEITIESIGIRI